MVTSWKTSNIDIFCCPEESSFYSSCIEQLVLKQSQESTVILEFGSGDAVPVIDALKRTTFLGRVYGFELDEIAAKTAQKNIYKSRLNQTYTVESQSFFDATRPQADYLISNPPYLPALDNNISNPFLHGGLDGSQITRDLLSLRYPNVMLLLASYSNPESVIAYALDQGYKVENFWVTPLPFGQYSSEPKVRRYIHQMRVNKLAFYSQNIYLLAGVLFKKQSIASIDLSNELLQMMTAL